MQIEDIKKRCLDDLQNLSLDELDTIIERSCQTHSILIDNQVVYILKKIIDKEEAEMLGCQFIIDSANKEYERQMVNNDPFDPAVQSRYKNCYLGLPNSFEIRC